MEKAKKQMWKNAIPNKNTLYPLLKLWMSWDTKKRMLSVTPLERGWLWAVLSGTKMQTKNLASASKKE